MAMRIALIDYNKDLCGLIHGYFESKKDFDVVGYAHSGRDGMKLIERKRPDTAIIDILLPDGDGFSILEGVRTLKIPVKIFVITSVSSNLVTKKAIELGASYIMLKPFDFKILEERIKFFAGNETAGIKENLKNTYTSAETMIKISSMLLKIGIRPHLSGSKYLRTGIMAAIENPMLLNSVTKLLYPKIAKDYATNNSSVERAIRHVIERAWEKGCPQAYQELFEEPPSNGIRKRPSNGRFIQAVVRHLVREL